MFNFGSEPLLKVVFNSRGLFGFDPIPFTVPNWVMIPPLLLLSKFLIQSDAFRNIWPFTRKKNNLLKNEISELLKTKSSSLKYTPKIEMPVLSYKAIRQLTEQGFIAQENVKQIEIKETNATFSLYDKELLGRGAFGSVFLGQETQTGSWVAIKMQRCLSLAQEQNLLIEAKYLLEQNQLLGYYVDEKAGLFYTIMPLFVRNDIRNAPIEDKLTFAIEFAKAIKRLHDSGRTHNDLHLGNVCWDKKEKICRTIDFGSITRSDHFEETSSYAVPRMPWHRPPESQFAMMNFKSGDVYAYGCILHSLFEQTSAFDNKKFDNFIKKLKHPLWFRRPSLQEAITFLQENQSELQAIKEKSQFSGEDSMIVCREKIDHCREKINILEEKISQAKSNVSDPKGFLKLSLMIKKLHIYHQYISGLYGAIDPFWFNGDFEPSWYHELLENVEKSLQADITKYKIFKRYQLNLSVCDIKVPTGEQNSFVPGLNLEISQAQAKRYLSHTEVKATPEDAKHEGHQRHGYTLH